MTYKIVKSVLKTIFFYFYISYFVVSLLQIIYLIESKIIILDFTFVLDDFICFIIFILLSFNSFFYIQKSETKLKDTFYFLLFLSFCVLLYLDSFHINKNIRFILYLIFLVLFELSIILLIYYYIKDFIQKFKIYNLKK